MMVVGAYGTEDGVGVLVAGDGTEVEVELKEAGECSVTLVKFSKHAELLGIAFSDGTVKVVDVGGGGHHLRPQRRHVSVGEGHGARPLLGAVLHPGVVHFHAAGRGVGGGSAVGGGVF